MLVAGFDVLTLASIAGALIFMILVIAFLVGWRRRRATKKIKRIIGEEAKVENGVVNDEDKLKRTKLAKAKNSKPSSFQGLPEPHNDGLISFKGNNQGNIAGLHLDTIKSEVEGETLGDVQLTENLADIKDVYVETEEVDDDREVSKFSLEYSRGNISQFDFGTKKNGPSTQGLMSTTRGVVEDEGDFDLNNILKGA